MRNNSYSHYNRVQGRVKNVKGKLLQHVFYTNMLRTDMCLHIVEMVINRIQLRGWLLAAVGVCTLLSF
jgi:hypothetical protein